MLEMKPAIQTAVRTVAMLRGGAALASPSPAGVDDSDPPSATAALGNADEAAFDRSVRCCDRAVDDPSATCQDGTTSSSAGIAAAQTIAADRIQWRTAADCRRSATMAASAARTINDAFISTLRACLCASSQSDEQCDRAPRW